MFSVSMKGRVWKTFLLLGIIVLSFFLFGTKAHAETIWNNPWTVGTSSVDAVYSPNTSTSLPVWNCTYLVSDPDSCQALLNKTLKTATLYLQRGVNVTPGVFLRATINDVFAGDSDIVPASSVGVGTGSGTPTPVTFNFPSAIALGTNANLKLELRMTDYTDIAANSGAPTDWSYFIFGQNGAEGCTGYCRRGQNTYSGSYSYISYLSSSNGVARVFVVLSDTAEAPGDISTRIIELRPENGTTTSNPVQFFMHAYVNPDDIGTFTSVKFTLHNIDQNVLLLAQFSPSDIYLFDQNATTSGHLYFSTSTILGEGNYRLEATIMRTYLGGFLVNPFSSVNQSTSTQFVVGQPTFIGNMSQNGFNTLQAIFASTSATSTEASARTCNPLSGTFDIIHCAAFLFIPGGQYFDNTIKGLRDGILTRWPWGYATRFINILSATTTSPLPTISAPVKLSETETVWVDLDIDEMVIGGGEALDSIRDPFFNKSPREIAEPIIQFIIALAVVMVIVKDISGLKFSNREED